MPNDLPLSEVRRILAETEREIERILLETHKRTGLVVTGLETSVEAYTIQEEQPKLSVCILVVL